MSQESLISKGNSLELSNSKVDQSSESEDKK
jgi:hypothetical protein